MTSEPNRTGSVAETIAELEAQSCTNKENPA
jgi:hypothetical protein